MSSAVINHGHLWKQYLKLKKKKKDTSFVEKHA